MYCKKCGKELDDSYKCCPFCGAMVNEEENYPQNTVATNNKVASQDSGSIGWAFLGFFIPLIGLILYLVWHDNKPKTAKKCGVGALIGVISSIVFTILWMVIIFVIASNMPADPSVQGGSEVVVAIINYVL